MVISSRSPEAVAAASLAARIERAVTRPAYLLVMHTDDFARMAWRHGRRAAQLLERKTSADLAEVARRLLLDEDAFVHASGSDVYVVALCDPEHAADDPLCDRRRHFRAVLERAFLDAACVEMISSWAALRAGADVPRAIEGAIAQGYRQRERRAYAELLHDLTTLVSGIRGSLATALDDSVDRRTVHRFLESALRGGPDSLLGTAGGASDSNGREDLRPGAGIVARNVVIERGGSKGHSWKPSGPSDQSESKLNA